MSVPIRAIVGRFSFGFSRRALESVLAKEEFDFLSDISIGDFPPFGGLPAERQERFPSGAIRGALYRGVDWSALEPLDETLIGQMRECEAVFMMVVSRLEFKRSIPYLTRKLWYLRHLQFWSDYLTRHQINLYLSAWIPHEIPDIIIYYLCKVRGIPVLYFDITVLQDVSFAGRDVRHAASQIRKRYEELLAAPTGDAPDSIPLGEPFASYERALTSPAGKPPPLEAVYLPSYWQQLRTMLVRRPFELIGHGLRLLTPAGWKRTAGIAWRYFVVRRMEHFYDTHAVSPDLTRPFVYFPLHYQPEASTVPQGGIFADQILAVRLLSAALPEGVLLYVKEHPRRSGWLSRSIQYYADFLELPNVRFVPRTFDTFVLREHCTAVATITGSAGFESLFRGKPVFLFGSCYYQYARGVFPIRTREECISAVRAVFEKGEKPTRLTTHLYLKAMEETCVRGVPDPWYILISTMTEDAHAHVMGEAIAKELQGLRGEIGKASLLH
jgi:hypothetical protein